MAAARCQPWPPPARPAMNTTSAPPSTCSATACAVGAEAAEDEGQAHLLAQHAGGFSRAPFEGVASAGGAMPGREDWGGQSAQSSRRPPQAPQGTGRGTAGDLRQPSAPVLPFVSVAVRVRPTSSEEPIAVWAKPTDGHEESRRLCCHRGYVLEEYEFSRVFSPEDDNRRLFLELQGPRLAASVFSGINETLFAYGQTGSGKTHTIFGTREEPGLLQLFVRSLFDRAAQSPGSTVHACCYEVLGDALTDLVDAGPFVARGLLRPEDVVCDELFIKTQKCRYQIVRVSNVDTCLNLLQDARVNRTAGVSSCNLNSSRTHAVVHLFVQNPVANQTNAAVGLGPEAGVQQAAALGLNSTIGALTLVDLAGTEKEHENPSEQGRKSARLLNTSLSSLNRLLRKLQTGCLDESERRQSVLNKCLWEYMRPGCGIALIFCVNPLLRHRTITLSTLAMATDSKTINNQRKAQYVQLPGPEYDPPGVKAVPSSSPRRSHRQPGVGAGGCPGTPCASPEERTTPRGGTGRSTPRGGGGGGVWPPPPALRPRSSPAGGRGGANGENCLTPRSRRSSRAGNESSGGISRLAAPPRCPGGFVAGGGAAWGASPAAPSAPSASVSDEVALAEEALLAVQADAWSDAVSVSTPGGHSGYERFSPASMHHLEVQNSRLRQKLSKTRARSQERVLRADRDREQTCAENAALSRECRSLRGLFIRQQQQQIAFWTGPFMEMLAPKDGILCDFPGVPGVPVSSPTTAAAAAAMAGLSGGWPPSPAFAELSLSQRALAKASGSSSSLAASAVVAAPQEEGDRRAEGMDSGEDGEALPSGSGASASASSGGGTAAAAARRECLRALRRERDYWRSMATDLKREMHGTLPSSVRAGVGRGGAGHTESDDLSSTPYSTYRARELEGVSSEGTAAAASALGCCTSSSSSTSSLPGFSASVASTGAATGGGRRSIPDSPCLAMPPPPLGASLAPGQLAALAARRRRTPAAV